MNKKEIDNVIFNFWNNYLNFGKIPDKGKIKIIEHNKGLELNEINIISFYSGGIVVSIGKIYFKKIKKFILENGFDIDLLKKFFEKISNIKTKIFGPVISLYLFSDKKLLLNNDDDVRILKKDNLLEYNEFMQSCIQGDLDKVDINLLDYEHKVFALYKKGNIIGIGNYSLDKKTKISHIGIIISDNYKGNGFGKILVNYIVKDILNNGYYPQYRVFSNNISSLKIAEGLGFKKVLEGISIIGK